MPTHNELKIIVAQRRRTVSALMKAEDWVMAAYVMGHTLECALKAVACKTLKLDVYPPTTKRKDDESYFRTHDFERLLIISGLRDIFKIGSRYGVAYQNWSDFTYEYLGDWISMRYDANAEAKFNEQKVKSLYKNLYDDNESILKRIARSRRW